jgi:hypothetical protein
MYWCGLLVLFVASVFLDPVQQSAYHAELTSSHVTYNSINFMLCLPLCISLLTVQSTCPYTWQCNVFFCLYQARKGRGRVYFCYQWPCLSVGTLWSCLLPLKLWVSIPLMVYSTQHYIIKFVSNLRQVGGFRRIPRLPPPIILTATT